jgi:prolyl-tRNA synthetase
MLHHMHRMPFTMLQDARTSTSVAAKTLCIPLEQPPLPEGTKCFISGKPAKKWVLWGRSY